MEKLVIFKRESNDFSDMLSDPAVKPHVTHVMVYNHHLMLGLKSNDSNDADSIFAYMMLKYSDSYVEERHLITDRSPVMFKDYWPKKKLRNNV
jgi:hypothetical protein